MRMVPLLLVALALVVAGCGGASETSSVEQEAGEAAAAEEARGAMESPGGDGAGSDNSDGRSEGSGGTDRGDGGGGNGVADGTRITVGDSEFGRMLFGANEQAIYIFENDSRDETVCYGQCAEDWPPVYTDGEPRAGNGVKQSLLGTVERRDGRLQVTYDGQPLYFYANEAPGEVRCHNVDLNGGLWWAVGPDANRLP